MINIVRRRSQHTFDESFFLKHSKLSSCLKNSYKTPQVGNDMTVWLATFRDASTPNIKKRKLNFTCMPQEKLKKCNISTECHAIQITERSGSTRIIWTKNTRINQKHVIYLTMTKALLAAATRWMTVRIRLQTLNVLNLSQVTGGRLCRIWRSLYWNQRLASCQLQDFYDAVHLRSRQIVNLTFTCQ